MSDEIVPGALTVAVTSGKGGTGKTTTATALATALAAQGIDVVVLDADVAGPNVHLLAELAKDEVTLGVDADSLRLDLPTTKSGLRIVTPVSVTDQLPGARVEVTDLIAIAQFSAPTQVVIVDLPPGWTKPHETVCATLPDLVVVVVAPTAAAISDHQAHLRAWEAQWAREVTRRRERDKRRKLDLPEQATAVTVETMARITGIPDGKDAGGTPVTVRRIDALPAGRVAALVDPAMSIPATASVADTAATAEVVKLAAMVTDLLGA